MGSSLVLGTLPAVTAAQPPSCPGGRKSASGKNSERRRTWEGLDGLVGSGVRSEHGEQMAPGQLEVAQ